MSRVLGVVLLAATVTACGGSPTPSPPPLPVATSLVPAALPAEGVTLQLDTSPQVVQAVSSLGKQLLVSDARLWEIHLSARLVGALQLATLKPRVNPAHAADRDTIIAQILGTLPLEIDLNGLPVWTTPDDGSSRAIYVWFGARTFGVLQLTDQGIRPASVADDLIAKIANQPAWGALPPEVYQGASSVSAG